MDMKEEFDAIAALLDEQSLVAALEAMENVSFRYPKLHIAGQLEQLRGEYELMADFWRRGYKDAERPLIHGRLVEDLRSVLLDARVRHANQHVPYLTFLGKRDTDGMLDADYADNLKHRLEKHVTDLALLELEQPHVADGRRKELLAAHGQLIADAFAAIVVSCSWRDGLPDAFSELMLSPTVDSMDQQMLVSAVTLACLNFFDKAKLRTLLRVYQQSGDVSVRQRALVGWAFCVGCLGREADCATADAVRSALGAEGVADELLELQMQCVHCMSAEADNRTINDEIMPEIVSYSRRHATPDGQRSEEDSLRDIMDPEASEREMERVEHQFRRMADMQKSGADIYFSGFSQMKRFPFFGTLSNWFAPFSFDNPSIAPCMEGQAGKLARKLLGIFPFCNSDKYSFVLALQSTFARIPEAIRDNVAVAPVDELTRRLGVDAEGAAYVRRGYLQDLYRFFRLFPSRQCFRNPFSGDGGALPCFFAAHALFDGTPLRSEANECKLASFLVKKGYDNLAAKALCNSRSAGHGYQYHMLCGALVARGHGITHVESASQCFRDALAATPSDRKARVALARALFREGNFLEAAALYEGLMGDFPERHGYALGYCICKLNAFQAGDVLQLLFKLDYEHPGDMEVRRALARAQMDCGKLEQAAKAYEGLVALKAGEGDAVDDLFNGGLCLWLLRRMADAASLFASYLHALFPHATREELCAAFRRKLADADGGLLQAHGFDRVELTLMEAEVMGKVGRL